MRATPSPMSFVYDAERSVMVPLRKSLADKTYVDGEPYRLGFIEERSTNSHNHFFASLSEAWGNLPEDLAERFPTADHLRRYALIKTGFFDERQFVASSKAEALRLAAFVRPMNDCALVVVKDNTVREFTAKSQSYRAMGKDEFRRSKEAVLGFVSSLIGVKADVLSANAGAAV